jgi:DNA-binding transcriptional regulator YhcF (GntR family)
MNFDNNKAIYLQIADYFYESILQDEMKAKERIPSVRELAIEFEVNPNTVMRTFQHLQDKKVIYSQRGIGYFISDEAYEIVFKMKKEEFISIKLPAIFKTMKSLNITMKELDMFYHDFFKKL